MYKFCNRGEEHFECHCLYSKATNNLLLVTDINICIYITLCNRLKDQTGLLVKQLYRR